MTPAASKRGKFLKRLELFSFLVSLGLTFLQETQQNAFSGRENRESSYLLKLPKQAGKILRERTEEWGEDYY